MHADVIIIGAGPTGLCLANTLAQAGLHSIVLERQALTAISAPAFDGREIALTHAAHQRTVRIPLSWGIRRTISRTTFCLNWRCCGRYAPCNGPWI